MSDGSANTEVWTNALACAFAAHTSEHPTYRDRARKHAAVLLYAFAWLAVTAEPLNLLNTISDATPNQKREERIELRGKGELKPFQSTDRRLKDDPEFAVSGLETDCSDRFSGFVLRTVSQICSRFSTIQIQSLVEHIGVGLTLGFGVVTIGLGLRRAAGFIQRSWAGQASCVRSSEMSAERRREARIRTRLREGLLYEGRRLVCDCVVIDRSSHGARIRTSRRLRAIQKLRFFDTYEQVVYEARIVWQKDAEAGLELAMLFRVGPRAKARPRAG